MFRWFSNLLSLIAPPASNHVSLKTDLFWIWDVANNFRNLSFRSCKWISGRLCFRFVSPNSPACSGDRGQKEIKIDLASNKFTKGFGEPSRRRAILNMGKKSWKSKTQKKISLNQYRDKKSPKSVQEFESRIFTLKSRSRKEIKLFVFLKNAFCFNSRDARNSKFLADNRRTSRNQINK